MAKIAVYNMDGTQCGELELNDSVFGVKVNTYIMHEAVVAHLANLKHIKNLSLYEKFWCFPRWIGQGTRW